MVHRRPSRPFRTGADQVLEMATAAIEVSGVTVVYSSARGLATLLKKHQVQIIQDINLSIQPGTVYGIAGESGSGKTTLARALTGLAPVSNGSITIHGREVAGLDEGDWRMVRSDVQLIFQDPYDSLNPRFTVFDSVAEPPAFPGGKGQDRDRTSR